MRKHKRESGLSRSGPATVRRSLSQICHWAKVWEGVKRWGARARRTICQWITAKEVEIYPRHDLILSKIRACEKISIFVNLREMGRGLRSVLVSLFSGCPHWVSRFFMVGPRREPEGGELSVWLKLSKGAFSWFALVSQWAAINY